MGETVDLVETVGAANLSLFGAGTMETTAGTRRGVGSAWGLGYFGQPHIVVRPRHCATRRRQPASPYRHELDGNLTPGDCRVSGHAYFTKFEAHQRIRKRCALMAQVLRTRSQAVLAAVLSAIMSTP